MMTGSKSSTPPSTCWSRSIGAGRSCSTRRIAGRSIRAPFWPPRGSISRPCGARKIPSSTNLIAGVVTRGYPMMRAHFPRCYVDVNREPYELDPRMFDGRLPSFANTRSMRVAGGLGTVARVVGDAQEIYDQRISVDDALQRIESLYKPYHRALRRLFTRVHANFGAAMLIDCHSMPSATGIARRPPARRYRARRPLRHELRRRRSRRRSRPLCARSAIRSAATSPMPAASSPSITAIPAAGLHAIQLEINRALYMDERRYDRIAVVPAAGRRSRDPGRPLAAIPLRNCGPIARRRNSRLACCIAHPFAIAEFRAAGRQCGCLGHAQKKKGPLAEQAAQV